MTPGKDLMMAPSTQARGSSRFMDYQSWVLLRAQEMLPIQRLMVACLIAFDGSWDRTALLKVLRRAHLWLDMDGQVAASWVEGGRVQRRLLSHFTALCWRSLPRTAFDWEAELSKLTIAYAANRSQQDPVEALDRLLHLARHWTSLVLPPLVTAHLDGVLKLAAVPDDVWGRRDGSTVPRAEPSSGRRILEDDTDVMYQAAADGKSETSPWFLDKLKATFADCVGPGINLSNDRAKRKLTENLTQLSSELVHAGVPGLLLYGWAQDLLVNGSVRMSTPAIQTLRNYIHVAGPALLRGMNAEGDVLDLEVDGWRKIYETAQLLCSEGQIRVLNPALASFHRYLVRALDVDPIWEGLFAGEDALPEASVIWPHELDTARQILMGMPVEERLQSQALVVLSLLTHTSLRRAEICTLRLKSIWYFDDGVVMDVSPKRSHKSGKSKAARRRMVIRDAEALTTLRGWVERRRSETAVGDDLLFADPHRPHLLYMMGQTYTLVMNALKDATGDMDVGWHTCRHSFASSRLATALMTGQIASVSPLHRLQRTMGHASLITTLQTYCHCYEVPLRCHLDAAIAKVVTSCQLENWTGDAASTLRQRKRRTGVEGSAYVDMAFAHTKPTPAPELSTSPEMGKSSCPVGKSARVTLTPKRVLHILSDIKKGLSVAGICAANSITQEWLERLCELVLDGNGELNEGLEVLAINAAAVLSVLDFSRLDQPRWQRVLGTLYAQPFEQGRAVAFAWDKHGSSVGLSMDAPAEVSPVLRVLGKSGFLTPQLRLRTALRNTQSLSPRSIAEHEDLAGLTVADAFGETPLVELIKPRKGRPYTYLILLTRASTLLPAPPAAVDSKSLHAAMYTHSIYVKWRSHCEKR